jgi:hypothetical protein
MTTDEKIDLLITSLTEKVNKFYLVQNERRLVFHNLSLALLRDIHRNAS